MKVGRKAAIKARKRIAGSFCILIASLAPIAKKKHDEAARRHYEKKNVIHSTETEEDDKESQYLDTAKSSLVVKTIENSSSQEKNKTDEEQQKCRYSDAVKSSFSVEESKREKDSSKEETKNIEFADAEKKESDEYPKLQTCNSKNEAVEIRIPCYIDDKCDEKRIEVQPKQCNICKKNTNLICSQCRCMFYCSKDHQRKDWKIHGALCRMLARKNACKAKRE